MGQQVARLFVEPSDAPSYRIPVLREVPLRTHEKHHASVGTDGMFYALPARHAVLLCSVLIFYGFDMTLRLWSYFAFFRNATPFIGFELCFAHCFFTMFGLFSYLFFCIPAVRYQLLPMSCHNHVPHLSDVEALDFKQHHRHRCIMRYIVSMMWVALDLPLFVVEFTAFIRVTEQKHALDGLLPAHVVSPTLPEHSFFTIPVTESTVDWFHGASLVVGLVTALFPPWALYQFKLIQKLREVVGEVQ